MIKVLITRPRSQADEFARALVHAGFEPVCFPVIEIRPFSENLALERVVDRLGDYDWVVFTSVNGVAVFFDYLSPEGECTVWKTRFPALKIATIGPKTAAALLSRGVSPDLVPEEYVAEAILPGLGNLENRWVLLPRAENARQALPDAISAAGGIAHEIPVYQTVAAEPDSDGLSALKSGVGVITFTSPSTVKYFTRLVCHVGLDPLHLPGSPRIACIGPVTQQAAKQQGYTELLVADEYTTEGLVSLLQRCFKERK